MGTDQTSFASLYKQILDHSEPGAPKQHKMELDSKKYPISWIWKLKDYIFYVCNIRTFSEVNNAETGSLLTENVENGSYQV